MKQLFIALALFISSVAANATSLHPDTFAETANLTKFQVDLNVFGQEVTGALVKLNTVRNVITLTVKFKEMCPKPKPGQFACLAMSRPDLTIELPIVSARKSGCGDTYVAKQDKRPVDGALEQISLVDMSHALCEIFIPADGMTKVEYTRIQSRMTGGESTVKARFSGEALHPIRRILPATEIAE